VTVKSEYGVEYADAQQWLAKQPDGVAKVVVYDPPYAVGTPVRGREDGAAGSVFGPFSFLSKTLSECARVLVPGGIIMVFADWRRMPDLGYIASTVGLRPSTCIAWVRTRPGTGGLFRASWDPILIVSRGVPSAIDRAAIRNVVVADYPSRRGHPYEKPAEVFRHVFPRICRPGDLVMDPFAGSGVSKRVAEELGLRWAGCDIDPAYAEGGGFQHDGAGIGATDGEAFSTLVSG
jgi:site-specific DNA-methyltransferase (adenine-specific)